MASWTKSVEISYHGPTEENTSQRGLSSGEATKLLEDGRPLKDTIGNGDRDSSGKGSKETGSRKLTVKDKITVLVMISVNFLYATHFSIPGPIFPPLAIKKGMSETVIGFVIGVYNLIMFVTSPVVGLVINKVGSRFMFVSGAMCCAVSGILFGLLDYGPGGYTYTTLCFVTRGFEAIGSATLATASYAIIAQMFPDRIATLFSFLETAMGMGYMIGPVISASLYQVGGYYLPFLVLGILLGIDGVIALFTIPHIEDPPIPKTNSLFYFVTRPPTMLLFYTLNCVAITVVFLEPTFADFLSLFSMQPYQIGLVFLIRPAFYAFAGPFVGMLRYEKFHMQPYQIGLMFTPAFYAFAEPFVDMMGDTFHMQPYQIGLMFLITPAFYAFAGPFVGMLGDKKGYLMTFMIVGTLMCGVAFAFNSPPPFMAIQPKLWLVVVAQIIVGLFIAFAFLPIFPALLITALDLGYHDNFDTNGMVSGVLNAGYALGSGVLVDNVGFSCSLFVVTVAVQSYIDSVGYRLRYRNSGGFIGATGAGVLVDNIGFSCSLFVVTCLLIFDTMLLMLYALVERRHTNGVDIFNRTRALKEHAKHIYADI